MLAGRLADCKIGRMCHKRQKFYPAEREGEREVERGDKWRRVDSKPSESKYATNNGIMQL